MRYRPEIDGLRAVSVLAVFFFHLGDNITSGGYVGVDVFFVISGYLITSLILSERQRNEFSLVSFYARRIKRIAPALLAVVLATIALGYFILAPGDYALLARSSQFTLAGASNFFFFENTGYFDPHADTMPLLHTWSLGVEEQFYVIWPSLLIVLTSLSRMMKIPVLVFILAIVGASFAAFCLVGEKYQFYMPYSRAWELGLGAAIGFLPEVAKQHFPRLRKLLPWAGFALIGAAVSRLSSTVGLTGSIAAAVLGACFIIFAIEPKTWIHRILSSMPFVFIGKISYSLYLWHFPAIVFWRYYSGEQTIPSAYFAPFIVGVTAIAWLSWHYVEEPCRRATFNWQLVFAAFAGATLAVGYACWAIVATNGALARIPESVRPLHSKEEMWGWPCPSWHLVGKLNLCTGGAPWDTAAAHAVIWGDSNSAHFMPLLDVAGRQRNVSISLIYYDCAPMVAIGYFEIRSQAYTRDCGSHQKESLAMLQGTEISLIILSAAWQFYIPVSVSKAALNRLLPQVSAAGRTVVIMSEIPNWFEDPIPCVFAMQTSLLRSRSFRQTCQNRISGFDRSYFHIRQEPTDNMIRSLNGQNGVVVWPMVDSMCSERSCMSMVDGELIYFDSGHLRRNLKDQTKLDLATVLHFADLMELAKKN